MHVSIIVVHYNNSDDTDECLKSLTKLQSNNFDFTVYVVDNASQERYVLPVKLPKKKFKLITSTSNLGFTGGNNLGIYTAIEEQNSEYILLLNNDTVVSPHFLEALLKSAEQNADIGILSPKIYFAKNYEYHKVYGQKDLGSIIWYAGGSIDWRNLLVFHRGVDEIDRGQFDDQETSDFATGCCMLIKREVLEKIGYLDKKYFLYLEDTDLSLRAKHVGYQLRFVPDSVIWHKNAGSTGGSGSKLQQYYQLRNLLLFVVRYGSFRSIITVFRFAIEKLIFGTYSERVAVAHAVLQQYGKQPLIA